MQTANDNEQLIYCLSLALAELNLAITALLGILEGLNQFDYETYHKVLDQLVEEQLTSRTSDYQTFFQRLTKK